MENLSSIRELVNLWPKRADLVADMQAAMPELHVTVHQVHKWAEKGSIPAKFHYAILLAARARNLPVTAEIIAELHVVSGRAA